MKAKSLIIALALLIASAGPAAAVTTGCVVPQGDSGAQLVIDVNRCLSNLTSGSVSVATFGALCNGLHDDSPNFRNAISSLNGLGSLSVPYTGLSCHWGSTVTVPRGVSIRGSGVNSCNIDCTSNAGACMVFADGSGGALSTIVNGGGLRDCTLTGNGGTAGIYLGGDPAGTISPAGDFGNGGWFENVKIDNFHNDIQIGNNAWLETFVNPYIFRAVNDGLYYPDSLNNSGENIRIQGGQFDGNHHDFEEDANTFPNNVIFDGTSLDFSTSASITGSHAYGRFSGCHFENMGLTSGGVIVDTGSSGSSGNSALDFQGCDFMLDSGNSGTVDSLFKLNGNLDQLTIGHSSFGNASGQIVTQVVDLPSGVSSNQLVNITNITGFNSTATMASWLPATASPWTGEFIQPNNPNAPAGGGVFAFGMVPIGGATDAVQFKQSANNNNTFLLQRATDTSPGGTLLRAVNAAGSANIFSIDARGNFSGSTFDPFPGVTTRSGTAGTAACSESIQGTLKMATCYLNAYQETGAAQTFTYPAAFSTTPIVLESGGSCGTYNPTSTSSTLTLPANAAMTAETCNISVLGQ